MNNELNIKELVKSVKFYTRKKENYSQEDIYEIEEQLKNKIISEVGPQIDQMYKQTQTQIVDLTNQLNGEKEKITNVVTEKSQFEKEIENFKKKLQEKDTVISRFEKKQKATTAKELLKGLVIESAEVDVYNFLEPVIKDAQKDFNDEMTLEEKQEILKPHVEGLIKAKPYLEPIKKDENDNKALVKKKVELKQEEEEEKEKEFNLNYNDFGYNG